MKSFEIEGVGKIILERSKRAKRINISVRPFRGVRVAVPLGISYNRAENFARSQSGWIRKQLSKTMAFEVVRQKQSNCAPEIDKEKARKKLVQRLVELANRHGFTFNKVTIRNQKTRWGSCSAQNNISLNMKLVSLPQQLGDYVMLHELVHTRIKNHGKKFWKEFNRIMDHAKTRRSQLREYNYLLF